MVGSPGCRVCLAIGVVVRLYAADVQVLETQKLFPKNLAIGSIRRDSFWYTRSPFFLSGTLHKTIMPTLTLVSLYNAQKSMYASQLDRARAELERFKEDLVTRFGQETADAVKMQVSWTEDMIFGRVEVPKLTDEGFAAVKTLREIIGKVNAVVRKIRTPDCWFRESVVPISVLETVGWSWRSVEEKYVEDEQSSLPGVLWLLSVLHSTSQVMPSDEQVWVWAGSGVSPCHLPHEWRRVLRIRKRRLAWLLRSAAELEEEVRYGQ